MENTTTYTISKFQAARQCKCPRCRTGAMFAGSLLSLKGQKMAKYCPHCQLKFEMEPGFFYVSMFVSYALNVAQFISVCVATYVLSGQSESPWVYLIACCLLAILLAGFNFRYSRVIQLYWLTPNLSFNPKYYGRKKAEDIKLEA
ncbi:DUF983 domain-containing protein [Sphingobacterium bambusae]|uniref:DUF983 domain-containing protein n=1 Tax=Sphingobacterium bambusae TaxID=662858 RepID=A0ABW6BFC1_9SPHI|nr:DUF983 domain-containing protein [Sphingobacterium bambusae]WPL47029.1 DUF983 domain-containing protein [Sphingobacterium bambusae]